jgi:hypothetical protein
MALARAKAKAKKGNKKAGDEGEGPAERLGFLSFVSASPRAYHPRVMRQG